MRLFKKIVQYLGIFFLFLISLMLIIALVVHIPAVQRFAVDKATVFLAGKTGTNVHIGGFSLFLWDMIEVTDIYIEDQHKDTLFHAERIGVDIDFSRLISRVVELNYVGLESARISITKKAAEDPYNFQFLIDAFSSGDSSTPSPWEFSVETIRLKNIHFSLSDHEVGLRLETQLGRSELGVESLTSSPVIRDIYLSGTKLAVSTYTPKQKKVKTSEAPPGPLNLLFRRVMIEESEFRLDNEDQAAARKGIDWNHLDVRLQTVLVRDLSVTESSYAGNVKEMNLQEKSGFVLNDLAAAIDLEMPHLAFDLDKFSTPHSSFTGMLKARLPDLRHLDEVAGKITFEGDLDNALLHTNDLFFFVPEMDTIKAIHNKSVKIDGKLNGSVNNFTARNFLLQLDEHNRLSGDFKISGILDPEHGTCDARVRDVRTTGQMLRGFIPQDAGFDPVPLGNIKGNGTISGNLSRLQTDFDLKSEAGEVRTDIRLGFGKNYALTYTEGYFTATDVELGRLLRQSQLGVVEAEAEFRTRDGQIIIEKGLIRKAGYNGYTYRDVNIGGIWQNNTFNGAVESADSNARLKLHTVLDLRQKLSIEINGHIARVDLKALNFSPNPLVLSGKLAAYMQGDDIDAVVAGIEADSLSLSNEKYEYLIDSIMASTGTEEGQRFIRAQSGFFTIDVSGNFRFSEIPAAGRHFLAHYYSGIRNDTDEHLDSLYFTVRVQDTKGLLRMFVPSMEVLRDVTFDGNWSGEQHLLSASLKVGEIGFAQFSTIGLQSFIKADQDKIDLRVHSGPLTILDKIRISKPDINGFIIKDSLFFHLDLADSSHNSGVDIEGLLALKQDSFYLNLDKIHLELKGNHWDNDGQARAVFVSDYFFIENFNLRADTGQHIRIASVHSEENSNILEADLKEVNLDEVSRIMPVGLAFDGILNASVRVINPLGNPAVEGTVKTKGLEVDKSGLGDLDIRFEKESDNNKLLVDGKLIGQIHELDIYGTVDVMGDSNALDFRILGRQIQLASIQPFIKKYVFRLNGRLDTRIHLGGTISDPQLTGEFHFTGENQIGIEAIKTVYTIKDERLTVSNSSINLRGITLYDKDGSKATLRGEIRHNFMKDFFLDLHLSGRNFLFLNSKEAGIIPFYGRLYADLDMSVRGPQDNIRAQLKLETRAKTDISMSLASPEASYETPDYIRFVSPDTFSSDGIVVRRQPKSDTLKAAGVDLSSFNISGELKVNRQARVNIVVDPVNGDKISSLGTGAFRFEFDSENDMNLFGTYTVEEGSYTFTFLNVIKKDFKIDKESTISWQGDPADGILNVTARYETKASRTALVDDQRTFLSPEEARAASRPLPVRVFLFLKGELSTPEITFDIEIPESIEGGSGNSMVAQRLNQIKSEPGELNKQVMGIIAFNQFLPYDSWNLQGGAGTNNIAAQSVSKALNAQLGQLTDKLGGVDIEVNVENSQSLNLETFNLMASKQISERLSVSVGGNFNSANNPAGQASNTVFAGDYIIYYQLNRSGTLSLKIFSKSNPDLYLNYVQQVSGVTIQHSKQFDHLKNIF